MGHALETEREQTLAQIEAMTRDLEAMMQASESSNADDEHDPEGATIAFERAQTQALLDQAHRRLGDLDAALARLGTAAYGLCEVCGQQIGAERLEARPSARTCIGCARQAAR
ncbi:MAG: Zinc finger, DksA/TraR C4-type [Frankiales bacterium]|nr:Zinc finger, DksA/TraR C4-type [Frankiales bacterium]